FADAYGIGWALDTVDGVKIVSHGGSTNGFQAQLALVPSRRFAIAILSNGDRRAAAHRDIQRWALEHELGLRSTDPEPITLPAEALERVVGTYKRPHSTITLSVDEGRLKAEIQMSSPLTGETETLPPLFMSPLSEQEFIVTRSEEHTSELQSRENLVCRLLLEKKKKAVDQTHLTA